MPKGVYKVPVATNEPVRNYGPNSAERESLQKAYDYYYGQTIEIPQVINGKAISSQEKIAITPPHDHQKVIAYYHKGNNKDVKSAIDAALDARHAWSKTSWEHRASIFLKMADLIAGPYRDRLNAATMLGQGKNAFQAEIDAACEMIDFLRFNVSFMEEIYQVQPISSPGVWNRVEYRPLEGFLYAVTPFNFTAIAGNLPTCMALMGNVVVWKPSDKQVYSAHVLMEIFKEAGLPDGVINMVLTDAPETTEICMKHPDFSGIHFTGSTHVFKSFFTKIGENIDIYKTYPRIVGETGGKDFIFAHPSADAVEVATAMVRGAFEYQGQKCSAASRAYIPKSIWPMVKEKLTADLKEIKVGSPQDFSNFVNAVIDKNSFDKITSYIQQADKDPEAKVILGGTFDDSIGYFIDPTIIEVTDPKYRTMTEEIFGPVLSVYIYEDKDWRSILTLVDQTSVYALTGAVFAKDRQIIEECADALENSAGNFYINDKPTGAVVGQQPFGGARLSGTNDKAGMAQNLLRWVSVRTIKETLVSPTSYRYPFLD